MRKRSVNIFFRNREGIHQTIHHFVVLSRLELIFDDVRARPKIHESRGIKPVGGVESGSWQYRSKPRHWTLLFRNRARAAADASTSRRCVPRPSGVAIL